MTDPTEDTPRLTILGVIWRGLAVGALAVVVHAILEERIRPVVSAAMSGRHVEHPPYTFPTQVLAVLTGVEQGIGFVVAYFLMRGQLPGRNSAVKGLVLAAVVLALDGELVRQPVMNASIGNPPWLAVLQQLDPWAAVSHHLGSTLLASAAATTMDLDSAARISGQKHPFGPVGFSRDSLAQAFAVE